jgi:hypothetical protein
LHQPVLPLHLLSFFLFVFFVFSFHGTNPYIAPNLSPWPTPLGYGIMQTTLTTWLIHGQICIMPLPCPLCRYLRGVVRNAFASDLAVLCMCQIGCRDNVGWFSCTWHGWIPCASISRIILTPKLHGFRSFHPGRIGITKPRLGACAPDRPNAELL